MRQLIKEPLVQFIALGAALFAGHMLWQNMIVREDYTIDISADEMARQAEIFASENRRQPTDEDLQALVYSYVEEEVLMREARRLGLDADDTIIRRRLAQKMRFMLSDDTPPELPDEAELRAWYAANQADFVAPETRAFQQIYFSPQSRGNDIERDAKVALENVPADWKKIGDPFMLARETAPMSPAQLTQDYGRAFAKSLFEQDAEGWTGPIGSAFGLHLVRITAQTPQRTPTFEEARADIEAQWQDQALRAKQQGALRDAISKYDWEVSE